MTFNKNKRLDTSQVQDRRGRRGGRRVAVGGGGVGILLIVVYLLLGGDPSELISSASFDQASSGSNSIESVNLEAECVSGEDANQRQDCRLVGFVNSVQAFWGNELKNSDVVYQATQTVLFSGSTDGACGYASSVTGPFYCPRDQLIYVDLAFFETLQSKFGAEGGPLAEAFVISHEYGHHIQNLFGILNSNSRSQDTGPDSEAVFVELQADCLAGVWMNHASETGYLLPFSKDEIKQAMNAALAVGDDSIQQRSQGKVVPEAWTHGSSEQRMAALWEGIQSGDLSTCNSPGWDE